MLRKEKFILLRRVKLNLSYIARKVGDSKKSRERLINLNKQGKMYNQGMAPVTRTLPGKPHWERIRDRPIYSTDDNTFTLSFRYKTSENVKATTFFAFTYPYLKPKFEI